MLPVQVPTYLKKSLQLQVLELALLSGLQLTEAGFPWQHANPLEILSQNPHLQSRQKCICIGCPFASFTGTPFSVK
jgi:hypothetical protein